MTRKLTRNTGVLRGIAPLFAVLTVMIALAALAQTRGAGQAFGKYFAGPVSPSTSAPMLVQARPLLTDGGDIQRATLNRLQTKRLDSNPLDANPPLFLQAVTYRSLGASGQTVVVADVNADGKSDLVMANYCNQNGCGTGNGNGELVVFLGNGDGTFAAPGVNYDSGGVGTRSVAVADVNGDGKLDLLVANENAGAGNGTVGVLLGNGDGTFQSVVMYASGGLEALSVAVEDVNGDGKPDLLVSNSCINGPHCANGTVGVLLGNGDGTFQTAVSYDSGGANARSIAVADVNGDGKSDLLVANMYAGTVGVLLGNGDGTFKAAVNYGSGGMGATSVAVGDLNGDGKPDLLVANDCIASAQCGSGTVGVLLGNGDGTFQAAVNYASGAKITWSGAIADVNGDGKPDLLLASVNCYASCQGTASVLLGNGDGTFQTAIDFGSGGVAAVWVTVADVNGDGRPDLLVVNISDANVGVLLNNTGPHSPTTTTMVSTLNPAPPHKAVIFTATVTSQDGGAVTGSVLFKDGGSTMGTAPLAGGQAVFSAVFVKGGPHPITATYSGDLHNLGNTSATLVEYVSSVSTKTVVTTSVSPSYVGQPVTFTATITPNKGTIPDGELVSFYDGTTAIGTGGTASGVATFTTSSLKVKTHTIKATYAGDATFIPSLGTVQQVVNKYPTTTTLSSSLNPSQFGQAVTFTAHVTSTGPAPTGSVKFLDGTTSIGLATLSGGVAKLTKSNLAVGTHSITAHYNGDAASSTSTSPVVNQVVQ
jgi:hypothetical protein